MRVLYKINIIYFSVDYANNNLSKKLDLFQRSLTNVKQF